MNRIRIQVHEYRESRAKKWHYALMVMGVLALLMAGAQTLAWVGANSNTVEAAARSAFAASANAGHAATGSNHDNGNGNGGNGGNHGNGNGGNGGNGGGSTLPPPQPPRGGKPTST